MVKVSFNWNPRTLIWRNCKTVYFIVRLFQQKNQKKMEGGRAKDVQYLRKVMNELKHKIRVIQRTWMRQAQRASWKKIGWYTKVYFCHQSSGNLSTTWRKSLVLEYSEASVTSFGPANLIHATLVLYEKSIVDDSLFNSWVGKSMNPKWFFFKLVSKKIGRASFICIRLKHLGNWKADSKLSIWQWSTGNFKIFPDCFQQLSKGSCSYYVRYI